MSEQSNSEGNGPGEGVGSTDSHRECGSLGRQIYIEWEMRAWTQPGLDGKMQKSLGSLLDCSFRKSKRARDRVHGIK